MASRTKTFDGGLFSHGERPVVIGIDQSYTGFALTAMAADGDAHYYTWVYQSDGRGIDRLIRIHDWLKGIVSDLQERNYNIVDAGVEAPVRVSHSALISGELFAVVRLALRQSLDGAGRYPLQVPPTTLKKYVTGKGTGVQKNQMLLFTFKHWDVEFTDDNAADSYGIARIVSGRSDTAYQKEVLSKMKDPKHRDAL